MLKIMPPKVAAEARVKLKICGRDLETGGYEGGASIICDI
jgi:hypothetical protein